MSDKFTKFAKGQECQVRLPMVCSFDPATTVLAHGNGSAYDKAMHGKSRSWQGAFACFRCHDVYDRRAPAPEGMSREEVELAFADGVMRTQRIFEDKGLLKAA